MVGFVTGSLRVARVFFSTAYNHALIGAAPLRMHMTRLSARVPDGLVAAPTDLRAVDPYVAEELVQGRLALAGRVLEMNGTSPFMMEAPSQAFEDRLHAFGWLRHVRASKSDEACARARNLASDWIAIHGRTLSGTAWTPDIAAQRLIAWLSHSPVVLLNADGGFYRRFLKSLTFHVRYLTLIAKYAPDGEVRLKIRIALAMASISMPNRASKIARAGAKLDREMERQILGDGGHVSRNPRVMLELLLDLLPLRQSYINLGHDVPIGLVPAIDRMFPAIRFFRHQDGDLALFNGATVTLANELASVLRYDETSGRPSKMLPDVGYQRLSAGDTVVIVDTGSPASLELSRNAHCGCLSFELSSVKNRFIVNAGFPQYATADFRRASRSTAAQSTVTLGDTSSSRLSRSRLLGAIMVSGVAEITVARETDQNGSDVLLAVHDGYLKSFGYLHEREVELNASGTKIKGRDAIKAPEPDGKSKLVTVEAVSRFHVHPLIELTQTDDETVSMRAPDGTCWVFSAPGKSVTIGQDIFMADVSGIRSSKQIEIAFAVPETREIRWIIERKQ